MKINVDLARIKTDLSRNETDYAASVRAVASLTTATNTNIKSLQTRTTALENWKFATKLDWALTDNSSKSFTADTYSIYLFLNTHIYKGEGVLIMYHPTVGLRTITIFGTPNIEVTNSGRTITIKATSQCRGQLYKINANS